MPSATRQAPNNGITKLTNCRLVLGDALVSADLWVSSKTGKIVRSQSIFYDEVILPDQTVDLGGRIVAPGLIECQLNGAFGFSFSTILPDMTQYGKKIRELNRELIKTGVTSYIPTVTSQTRELYHKVCRINSATQLSVFLAEPSRFFRSSAHPAISRSPKMGPNPSAPTSKGHSSTPPRTASIAATSSARLTPSRTSRTCTAPRTSTRMRREADPSR